MNILKAENLIGFGIGHCRACPAWENHSRWYGLHHQKSLNGRPSFFAEIFDPTCLWFAFLWSKRNDIPRKTLKHIWKQHTQIDMNIYMIFIYNIWYMGELYWCHLTFLEMNEGCFEVNPWPSMSGNGMVKCHNSSMPKCVVYTLTYVVRYIYIYINVNM